MITVDTTFQSDASVNGNGTADYNVTCNGDLMIVAIYLNQTTAAGTIDNPKYNGVSFTKLFGDTSNQQLYVGYLKNPSQGTNQFHTIFQGGTPTIFRSAGISLIGSRLSSPMGADNSTVTQTANTPNSLTVTPNSYIGLIVDFLFLNKSSSDAVVDASQTQFVDYFANDNTTVVMAAASYKAHTGSPTTMTWASINCPANTWQMHYAVEVLGPLVSDGAILIGND